MIGVSKPDAKTVIHSRSKIRNYDETEMLSAVKYITTIQLLTTID